MVIDNIVDHFDRYFQIVPAISDELKNEVYKLRYQVYCIENEFLNSEDYPNDLEFDDYDQHSVHYLIRHRKSGICAATTRLILPNTNNLEKPLQIETYSRIDNVNPLKTMSRHKLAELSRFCISKQFRQRKYEQHLLCNDAKLLEATFSQNEKRSLSYLMLALFACAIKMSAENNIHYWYAIMTPALNRVVSTLGIHFTEIGPFVDFHGLRRPYVIKVDDLLDSVAEKNLDYWNMLTNRGNNWQAKPNEKRVSYIMAQQP
ncbi:MAG: PEP-CTERM/exosortase system-associated acyltransferase [Methylococcaceae bacterium]|nr:PEP-CTERM/exosortase system-associated acyltransferase [Methylococcaceae bacterium]